MADRISTPRTNQLLGIEPYGSDPVSDIFGEIRETVQTAAMQVQMLRNQIAQAQQQTADVAGGRWTLNNLAAQWDMMSQQSQRNLILLTAVAAYALWA